MAKQVSDYNNELNALQNELDKQLKISEEEFNKAYKQNEKLIAEHNKKFDKFNLMFSDPELDQQLEKELDQIAKEIGVSFTDKEPKPLSSEKDNEIEKEYQKLLKEVESENQSKQPPKAINEFTHGRLSDISTLVKSHGSLAEEFANKSTNAEEKSQLKKFHQDTAKLTEILDTKVDKSTPITPKKISSIGVAVNKIYSGLKSGLSKAVDTIKGLGTKLMGGIKSLFNKSPREQNHAFAQTIKDTDKAIKNVKTPSVKLQKNTRELQDSFKKLQDQYAQILPKEKRPIYAKYRANKTAGLMSNQEIMKETKRIVKSIQKQAVINNKARKDEYNKLVQNKRGKNNKGMSI